MTSTSQRTDDGLVGNNNNDNNIDHGIAVGESDSITEVRMEAEDQTRNASVLNEINKPRLPADCQSTAEAARRTEDTTPAIQQLRSLSDSDPQPEDSGPVPRARAAPLAIPVQQQIQAEGSRDRGASPVYPSSRMSVVSLVHLNEGGDVLVRAHSPRLSGSSQPLDAAENTTTTAGKETQAGQNPHMQNTSYLRSNAFTASNATLHSSSAVLERVLWAQEEADAWSRAALPELTALRANLLQSLLGIEDEITRKRLRIRNSDTVMQDVRGEGVMAIESCFRRLSSDLLSYQSLNDVEDVYFTASRVINDPTCVDTAITTVSKLTNNGAIFSTAMIFAGFVNSLGGSNGSVVSSSSTGLNRGSAAGSLIALPDGMPPVKWKEQFLSSMRELVLSVQLHGDRTRTMHRTFLEDVLRNEIMYMVAVRVAQGRSPGPVCLGEYPATLVDEIQAAQQHRLEAQNHDTGAAYPRRTAALNTAPVPPIQLKSQINRGYGVTAVPNAYTEYSAVRSTTPSGLRHDSLPRSQTTESISPRRYNRNISATGSSTAALANAEQAKREIISSRRRHLVDLSPTRRRDSPPGTASAVSNDRSRPSSRPRNQSPALVYLNGGHNSSGSSASPGVRDSQVLLPPSAIRKTGSSYAGEQQTPRGRQYPAPPERSDLIDASIAHSSHASRGDTIRKGNSTPPRSTAAAVPAGYSPFAILLTPEKVTTDETPSRRREPKAVASHTAAAAASENPVRAGETALNDGEGNRNGMPSTRRRSGLGSDSSRPSSRRGYTRPSSATRNPAAAPMPERLVGTVRASPSGGSPRRTQLSHVDPLLGISESTRRPSPNLIMRDNHLVPSTTREGRPHNTPHSAPAAATPSAVSTSGATHRSKAPAISLSGSGGTLGGGGGPLAAYPSRQGPAIPASRHGTASNSGSGGGWTNVPTQTASDGMGMRVHVTTSGSEAPQNALSKPNRNPSTTVSTPRGGAHLDVPNAYNPTGGNTRSGGGRPAEPMGRRMLSMSLHSEFSFVSGSEETDKTPLNPPPFMPNRSHGSDTSIVSFKIEPATSEHRRVRFDERL